MILPSHKVEVQEDDVHRDCSWKYHWILLFMLSFVACKKMLLTMLTLSDYSPISRRINSHLRGTEESIPKFGTPPSGHPWHRWTSSSIDARYLIEELSLIDTLSLNESYNDPNMQWDGTNDLNTTFNPPYYRSLVPFVVRDGKAFHPKRKDAMVNTKRWRHLQAVLFDSLNLAKQLQHVDSRIRAVASGSFPFMLSHSDHTECNDYRGKEIPVFSWFSIASCNYSWPVPDYHFSSHKKENETEWDTQFAEWEEEYPWPLKQRKAVWRGTMTGPNVGGDWHKLPRTKLVQKSLVDDRNTTIDAGFAEHPIEKRRKPEEEAMNESLTVPRMRFFDFMNYRAIIDIDGNSWSSRYGIILCFNSVIIKIESPDGYQSYYESELKPWEHYIPVNSNMSDLDEAVAFAISDENQAKVQRIIKNAQGWCRSKLVRDQLAADFMWTLASYVELLNNNGEGWLDQWKENEHAYNMPGMNLTEVLSSSEGF